jgi:TRAP-type C4-dicarboxylate transport system permease small subunit
MRLWLAKLESRCDSVARFCALFGMLFLVALALITNVDVFMRWMFNNPIDGVTDVAPLMVAIVIASFFPFALAGRHHISITFIGNLLGPKGRAWLEATVALVTLAFFALLAWQFIVYTIDLDARGQTTWVVQLPVAPWWTVVSFFTVLCVAVQLIVLLTLLGRALR